MRTVCVAGRGEGWARAMRSSCDRASQPPQGSHPLHTSLRPGALEALWDWLTVEHLLALLNTSLAQLLKAVPFLLAWPAFQNQDFGFRDHWNQTAGRAATFA